MQPNMMLYTVTTIFYNKQSCTYLVEILSLAPTSTADFYASLMDNNTTFCILELGIHHSPWQSTFHWGLVTSWPFTGAGGFLACLFTFLNRRLVGAQN